MAIFDKTFSFIICCFELYLFRSFTKVLLEKRNETEEKNIYILSGSIVVLFFTNLVGEANLNLLCSFLIYYLTAILLYRSQIKILLYVVTIFFFIIIGGEFLVTIMIFLFGENLDLERNPFHLMMAMFSAKLLSFLVVQFLIRRNYKKQKRDIPYALTFYVLPLSSIMIYMSFFYSDIDFLNLDGKKIFLILSCLLLFTTNVACFIIFQKTVEYMEQISSLEMHQLENKLAGMHYEKTTEHLNRYRKLHHDMIPLLKTISSMVKAEQDEALLKLIAGIDNQIADISKSSRRFCNNNIINIILAEKEEEAERRKIKFTLLVEPSYDLSQVDEYDIVGIFHNVLENAVEAASFCPEEMRNISVQLFFSEDGKYSVLRVENSYVKKIIKAGNFLATSKTEGDHGIGLSIISERVEKYQGYLDYTAGEQIFCLTILLPIV